MGFYIRKAIRVGPFRFNLSKSGVGVSGGITGLRLGTGPRGNYVHMGRGGIYFRKSLNLSSGRPRNPPLDSRVPPTSRPAPRRSRQSVGPLEQVDSGSIRGMVDASSAELLRELNEKRKRIRLFPGAITLSGIVILVIAALGVPIWLVVMLIASRFDGLSRWKGTS